MLNKKNITLTTLAAAAGILLILSQTAGSDRHASLGGAWVGQVPALGVQWCGIHAPLDAEGERAAIKWQWVTVGPQFTALFAAFGGQASEVVGELEMVNHDTAKYTEVFHIVTPPSFDPLKPSIVTAICVMKGSWHFTGPDTAYSDDTFFVYAADADKDHDGLPDPKAEPLPGFPMTFTKTPHHRVPILK